MKIDKMYPDIPLPLFAVLVHTIQSAIKMRHSLWTNWHIRDHTRSPRQWWWNIIYCSQQLKLASWMSSLSTGVSFLPVLLDHLKWSSSCLATATTALLSRSPEPLQEGGVKQGGRQMGCLKLVRWQFSDLSHIKFERNIWHSKNIKSNIQVNLSITYMLKCLMIHNVLWPEAI